MDSKKIVWSERADQDLGGILLRIEKDWGVSVKQEFKKRLKRRLALLSQFPLLHRASTTNPRFRQSVLSKQTSIIYSVRKDTIFVVRLFDNRGNPKGLERL